MPGKKLNSGNPRLKLPLGNTFGSGCSCKSVCICHGSTHSYFLAFLTLPIEGQAQEDIRV